MTTLRSLMGSGVGAAEAQAILGTTGTVTSAGTGSIAAATLLPYDNNVLSPAASLDAYVLPTAAQGAQLGDIIYVYNPAATAGVVFSGTAEFINSTGSSQSVAQYKMAIFKRIAATGWGMFITP